MFRRTKILFAPSIVVVALLVQGCSPGQSQTTPEQVTEQLGPPDRIALLDGKVLIDVADPETSDFKNFRIVYVYEDRDLRVWFLDGVVDVVTVRGRPTELDGL